MEGEVGEGPELLADCAEAFGVYLVEVEHVEEVLWAFVSRELHQLGGGGGRGRVTMMRVLAMIWPMMAAV